MPMMLLPIVPNNPRLMPSDPPIGFPHSPLFRGAGFQALLRRLPRLGLAGHYSTHTSHTRFLLFFFPHWH